MKLLSSLLFVGLLSGCGNSENNLPEATPCQDRVAIVLVAHSFVQGLCGCEEAGAPVTSGTFTCTIEHGSAVIFHLQGSSRSHQILSTGTPGFVSTPLLGSAGPEDDRKKSHTTIFAEPGTYEFIDAFLPGISGKIVVQ
ncbi:MAG: hypothetical protein A2X94_11500 [Bdellovibrionales bacterium GWB1_55_8]|nr:MAG: hypothetical protein A2X94_11500 [Bdellovibrionales bacterium GWB1_55_8]